MARRTTTATHSPVPANLTDEQKRAAIPRLRRRIEELKRFNAGAIDERSSPEVLTLQADISGTITSIFGRGTIEAVRYEPLARLNTSSLIIGQSFDVERERAALAKGVTRSIIGLEGIIRGFEEDVEFAPPPPMADQGGRIVPAASPSSDRVFIVHGHDGEAREGAARFIQWIGLEPVILHEQANRGQTIIEKFEDHGDVGFAVVLLTPDDEGCKKGSTPNPRARQNVVFELGYFIGKLGRSRVCALHTGGIEIPTDIAGVLWVSMDQAGAWKTALSKELKAAGYQIDWNKVMEA